jgi:hypothetical protein
MKPLIAIPSCHKNDALRQACRDTWIKKWGNLADIRFFVGNPKRRKTRDTIYLDCPDDYDSLPLKVRLMHQWVLAQPDYSHVFKCDDDSWVHVPRLLASGYQREDYVGTRRAHFFAQGGAGYWLSRQAMQSMQKFTTEEWLCRVCEDITVGFFLQGKFPLTRDPRYVDSMDHDRIPIPKNDQITSHKCDSEKMHRIQALFGY